MRKITKKDVQVMFNRFVNALKRNGQDTIGLGLEYNPCYGGYLIYRKGDLGSESHPFSSSRQNSIEMYNSLYTATLVLESMIKY